MPNKRQLSLNLQYKHVSTSLFLGFIWRHKSDGGSTLKQNTVIRVSRLFVLCISLVFGGKYMEFRIIFSLQYSISINTFEVDPPSDSLHNAVVKPKNMYFNALQKCENKFIKVSQLYRILDHMIVKTREICCLFRICCIIVTQAFV
jgi:methyl coenzyme M reductase subunit C